jgi:hypothetical protein
MKKLSPGWILFLVLDFAICVALVIAILQKKG